MIDGRLVHASCLDIGDSTYVVSNRVPRLARLEDEWFEDVIEPEQVVAALKTVPLLRRPDLLTFWQRLPDTTPKYGYHMEWDTVAAVQLTTYEDWWNNQIQSNARGHIRKAAKKGVRIVETSFTDEFVAGMVEIFNEAPVRQGRRFWHYGKDAAQVKREFSRNLTRERLIGAYVGDELVGFVMLGICDRYTTLGQIISKINHRDKSPTNALLAKAVELTIQLKIPFLTYANWPEGPLADFKRQNGFECIAVPRYYVGLTPTGHSLLRMGLHQGIRRRLPASIRSRLKRWRAVWLDRRLKA
jgi:hypothetical protein